MALRSAFLRAQGTYDESDRDESGENIAQIYGQHGSPGVARSE